MLNGISIFPLAGAGPWMDCRCRFRLVVSSTDSGEDRPDLYSSVFGNSLFLTETKWKDYNQTFWHCIYITSIFTFIFTSTSITSTTITSTLITSTPITTTSITTTSITSTSITSASITSASIITSGSILTSAFIFTSTSIFTSRSIFLDIALPISPDKNILAINICSYANIYSMLSQWLWLRLI